MPRVGAHRAGVAGRERLPRRFLRREIGFRLQLRDHAVDRPARLPELGFELLIQAPAECVLALAECFVALAHPSLGSPERFALARRKPLLVLEGAHVLVDLGEVLGKLRLARTQVLARRRDD